MKVDYENGNLSWVYRARGEKCARWGGEFAGKLLKLRCSFGIIELELYRSVSRRVPKRAEISFMKSNGKCQLQSDEEIEDVFVAYDYLFLFRILAGHIPSLMR